MTATAPPLRWTFLLPSLPRPAGGLFAAYELANALAASGADAVRVVHLPTPEAQLASADDIPWFRFEPAVEHHFPAQMDPACAPEADVLLFTVMVVDLCLSSPPGSAARRLLDLLEAGPGPAGLPVAFVQALGVFPTATELRTLSGVAPKVCVAGWIAANAARAGVPGSEVVHVPNGLDHRTFRVVSPIADRPRRVAMNFNPHPLKNMDAGIEALERVERELRVPSVLFGTRLPARPPAGGMRFLHSPSQAVVAESILAGSSIYLQPSTHEGFGLCALEAMACGCALVTTANGGSADYARDGDTAVVCPTEPGAMADAIMGLLRDDERRVRLATAGAAHAAGFTWTSSAARLREAVQSFRADPSRLRAPRAAGLVLDPAALLHLP